MPYTRVLVTLGDPSEPGTTEDAYATVDQLDEVGIYATVETDSISVQIQADYDEEDAARDGARLIRSVTGLYATLVDPETGDEADA